MCSGEIDRISIVFHSAGNPGKTGERELGEGVWGRLDVCKIWRN